MRFEVQYEIIPFSISILNITIFIFIHIRLNGIFHTKKCLLCRRGTGVVLSTMAAVLNGVHGVDKRVGESEGQVPQGGCSAPQHGRLPHGRM